MVIMVVVVVVVMLLCGRCVVQGKSHVPLVDCGPELGMVFGTHMYVLVDFGFGGGVEDKNNNNNNKNDRGKSQQIDCCLCVWCFV